MESDPCPCVVADITQSGGHSDIERILPLREMRTRRNTPPRPHPAAKICHETIGCYSPNQSYIVVESRGQVEVASIELSSSSIDSPFYFFRQFWQPDPRPQDCHETISSYSYNRAYVAVESRDSPWGQNPSSGIGWRRGVSHGNRFMTPLRRSQVALTAPPRFSDSTAIRFR